jgi:simple sugar transport system ATP-binding protein
MSLKVNEKCIATRRKRRSRSGRAIADRFRQSIDGGPALRIMPTRGHPAPEPGRDAVRRDGRAPRPHGGGRPLVAVLELTGISKHFGAIQAVTDVSLTLEPGEVVGLMGDNGAGKSTLVKMIAGNFPPSHGSMRMDGKEIVLHRPLDARRHGIEIVHQDLALCDNLTAAANVYLGRELRRGFGPVAVLDHGGMVRRAGDLFRELKSETRPRDLIKSMSGGQRQAVAIARTMLAQARIVLMDEPTAAISVRQVAEVLHHIRHLRDQGIAVVLISHRMPDVFTVADRIIVLRRGRMVADRKVADSSPEEVTGLITGAIEKV